MNIKELALSDEEIEAIWKGVPWYEGTAFDYARAIEQAVHAKYAARDAEAVPVVQVTSLRGNNIMKTLTQLPNGTHLLFAHPAQVADVVPVAWEWRINHANGGYTRHLCTDEIEAKGYDDSYMMTGEITPLFTHAPAPVAVPEWISVSERLPERYTEVMVWPHPSDTVMTAQFGLMVRRGNPCWHYSEYESGWGWEERECTPSYWKPLPQAPKEES